MCLNEYPFFFGSLLNEKSEYENLPIRRYEFVLILGRAPLLAKYVRMLRHVSYNFLMMILLYGALLLAFTISFNIILQPTEADKVSE